MKSKKRIWLVFMIFCFAGIICAVYFVRDKEKETAATISKHYIPEKDNGVCFEYFQNENGMWSVKGMEYKKRLVLKRTLPLASGESEYVVLTNDDNLSFDEVAKSVYSSNSGDQLKSERGCIVEIR